MNEIPFSRLKPPSELFRSPVGSAAGAASLPVSTSAPQAATKPALPVSDHTQRTPLNAARSTPTPV
ncbi:MAG: hypothetical protein AB7I41_17840, partial [Candidatus Sericytochromatia bacterium]